MQRNKSTFYSDYKQDTHNDVDPDNIHHEEREGSVCFHSSKKLLVV